MKSESESLDRFATFFSDKFKAPRQIGAWVLEPNAPLYNAIVYEYVHTGEELKQFGCAITIAVDEWEKVRPGYEEQFLQSKADQANISMDDWLEQHLWVKRQNA